MSKRNLTFLLLSLISISLLTSGCIGYVLARPESVLTKLEREINGGKEDRIIQLYSEEVWVATPGNPSGRILSKDSLASFYADFFELYDDITIELHSDETIRDSSEATMTVYFSLEYSYEGKRYLGIGEGSVLLSGKDKRWKICGEKNNPILSIFEPADM
ncbi:MAG: nuclear transport factor 2 family protein [Kosmotogaceae bacterium]|nr:nuclear transport factor 2 family protein [Kosmotogaceae bacterium]